MVKGGLTGCGLHGIVLFLIFTSPSYIAVLKVLILCGEWRQIRFLIKEGKDCVWVMVISVC